MIARDNMITVDMGVHSNFSNYNMAFMRARLSLWYLEKDAGARAKLQQALELQLYAHGEERQPKEMKQTLYDFVYAAGMAGATVSSPCVMAPNAEAMANGLETLKEFPEPPYWEVSHTNCDEAEIAALKCVGEDGTVIELLGNGGWGDKLVAKGPIPMRIRPSSNYHWRSNP